MVMSHDHFTATPSSGAGAKAFPSGSPNLERVRYFPRKLVTADDFTQDQRYFRAKHRMHNRMLHGWGVVCGLEVTPGNDDWLVNISSGYALGPWGDEIFVECDITIDVSRQDLDGNALLCDPPADPWCASVRADRRSGQTIYIAIAYDESFARPVRAHPVGCGCGDAGCEYSRIRDGFVVRILDQLPNSHAGPQPSRSPLECPENGVRQCPDCPDEPWVVLASIEINGADIKKEHIDNRSVRRYVAAFGDWWFQCRDTDRPIPEPQVTGIVVATPAGVVHPGIVGFDTAPDGMSITLNLEEDVRMLDGRLLRAGGIVDILEANAEALREAGFDNLEVVDDRTVVVRLSEAGRANDFLRATSEIPIAVRQ